jgi:hypothetical protein
MRELKETAKMVAEVQKECKLEIEVRLYKLFTLP